MHSHSSEGETLALSLSELQQKLAEILDEDDCLSARYRKLHTGQELLKVLPNDHQRRLELLECLANALYDHFENTNEWDALETALNYLGEVISHTDEDDHVAVARLCHAYSQCLRSRFMRGRNKTDLENAIAYAESSVEHTKCSAHPEEVVTLIAARQSNLGLCLFTKAHQTDECRPEVLDRAIEIYLEVLRALETAGIAGYLWITAVGGLGLSLQVRWDQRHSFNDLEESIKLGYQVCKILPTGTQPEAWVTGLSDLAFRLQRAFKYFLDRGVSPSDPSLPQGEKLQEEALKTLIQSMEIESNRTLSKLENVLTFVTYIRSFPTRDRGSMLADLYPLLKQCMELLQDITLMSLRDDLRDCLRTFYGLSRYAAAAAIESGASPLEALQLLEEGRGIAMSIQLDSNQDVADLKITDPMLEIQYTEARAALTRSITQGDPFYERREKLRHLRDVQRKIRAQPGLADFNRALGEEKMKDLAHEGVIVVVNVTDLKCHALIITTTSVSVLPLPHLNEDELVDSSWVIQTYLAKDKDQHEIFPDLWEKLSALLKLLWIALAKPVLDHLGYRPCKSGWPHIWWIPTGILSLYPIHAAGTGLNKTANVMDRVISSYMPTLKALAQARSKYVRQARKYASHSDSTLESNKMTPTVAIITMHRTPSRVDLEFSEQEATVVNSYFPSSNRFHEPTSEVVLKTLRGEEAPAIVHFSCHGETNYDDPSQSQLLMADWEVHPLTVAKLQRLNMQSSQLAFLSACFTANAGVEGLQDEIEHLASAMQVAGFTSVIGSLWNVGQDAALVVVTNFYKNLAEDCEGFEAKRVAKALHLAVRALGETTRVGANNWKGNPVIWAPFIHFGV